MNGAPASASSPGAARRRSWVAATLPLLLAVVALVVLLQFRGHAYHSVARDLGWALGFCALLSLGPFAAFVPLMPGLPPWWVIAIAVIGWAAWLYLIRATRLRDLPAFLHFCATSIWLGAGFIAEAYKGIAV